jgi:mRNA-degrading endonuclease RelE of RelBE toxin-antitoxin system
VSDPKRRPSAPRDKDAVKAAEQPHAEYLEIGFSDSARASFDGLSVKEQNGLVRKFRALAQNPASGKPLTGELHGYYRVTLGRIRAVVRTAERVFVVYVLTIGPRKAGSKLDPYVVAIECLKRGDEDIRAAFAQLIEARFRERGE